MISMAARAYRASGISPQLWMCLTAQVSVLLASRSILPFVHGKILDSTQLKANKEFSRRPKIAIPHWGSLRGKFYTVLVFRVSLLCTAGMLFDLHLAC